MSITKTACCIAAYAMFVTAGSGALPNQDIGKDVLERVAETYNRLGSYQFEGTITTETKSVGVQAKLDAPFLMAATKPDKMRVEVTSPAIGMDLLLVARGGTTWEYLARQRQYTIYISVP